MTITDKQVEAALAHDAKFRITEKAGDMTRAKAMRALLEAAEAARDMWPLAERVRTALDRASCPDAYMRIAVETITVAAPSSAEQPAPGAPEADERARFEAWAKPRAMDLTRMKDVPYLCSASDGYYCNPAETGWAAWQARAQAIAAPSVAPVSARGEAVEPLRYFSWDDENSFETHATLDAARNASQESLDLYREEAAEGWPEQTGNLCYGVILGGARIVSTRPMTENEAAHYGEAGEIINYGLVDDAAAFAPPADARDGGLAALRPVQAAVREYFERFGWPDPDDCELFIAMASACLAADRAMGGE